jgi:hypothetical protein
MRAPRPAPAVLRGPVLAPLGQLSPVVGEHLKLMFDLWVGRGSRALLTFFGFGSADFGILSSASSMAPGWSVWRRSISRSRAADSADASDAMCWVLQLTSPLKFCSRGYRHARSRMRSTPVASPAWCIRIWGVLEGRSDAFGTKHRAVPRRGCGFLKPLRFLSATARNS